MQGGEVVVIQAIIPPKILLNKVYVAGLHNPLEDVAEVLDSQNQHEHARALRYACEIIDLYNKCLLLKTHTLHTYE